MSGVRWVGWSNGTAKWERCPVHGVWTRVSEPAIPCHRCPAPPAPTEATCCRWHTPTCEPPSELCCSDCTEGAHPHHRDGSTCVLPPAPTTRKDTP
jgi:hypothetical protein